jgi:hypothetical protein
VLVNTTHVLVASRSVLVVFLIAREPHSSGHAESDAVERELLSIPTLSIGLLSTAQGSYTPVRMLQDVNRTARLADASGSPGQLTLARLPTGPSGYARLLTLVKARRPGELVLILERASSADAHELRWAAVAGIGPWQGTGSSRRSTLTSQTTRQHGMIAALDIAPTLLGHLRLPVPASMRGKPIRLDGPLDGAALRSLKARLEVVYPRRLPALACLVGAWTLLLALLGAPVLLNERQLVPPATRARSALDALARAPGRLAWALRVGGLALLWTPVAALLPAALEPGAAGEYALLVGASFALGALTDALIGWPRAAIAPAAAAVLAIVIDALAGTQLLIRSLFGPNPAYGSRFYGIGNELKSGLAVLVLAAVAGALYRNPTHPVRSRRAAGAMAAVGALLAAVEGAARIGAGVGGVVLVCAGTAVATAMLLPGSLTRRRVLVAPAAPVLGLLLLAAIDLSTAHGAGHFTGSVLDARSVTDLQETIVRHYEAAWRELGNGLMPLATAAALVLAAAGIRYRTRLLAPVDSDPAWLAALAGGLTAGTAGALVEDSGPVLLLVAVFVLGCVLAYLWGKPLTPRSSRTPPAGRSRALRPSAGRAS